MSTTAGVPPQRTTTPAAPTPEAKTSAGLLPLSSLASKYVMAITGLGLTVFVIGHMVGNLQVFLGRDVLNAYAEFLKGNIELLWVARIGLLVLFVVHLLMGINLALQNRAARRNRYAYPRQYQAANISSRTMVWTGLVILAFLVYHLLHFTVGLTHPDHYTMKYYPDPLDPKGHQDVYGMVIRGFQNPLVVVSYIVAQIFLGLHLWHAVPSMFQSLGINRPRWQKGLDTLGAIVTIVVVGGNILMPTLIYTGIYVPEPIPAPPYQPFVVPGH